MVQFIVEVRGRIWIFSAPVPNCAGIKKYFLLFTLSGFLKKNASIKSIFSQTNQRKFSLGFLPFPDYSFSTDSITFLWNNTLQPHQTKQIATRYKNFDDSFVGKFRIPKLAMKFSTEIIFLLIKNVYHLRAQFTFLL